MVVIKVLPVLQEKSAEGGCWSSLGGPGLHCTNIGRTQAPCISMNLYEFRGFYLFICVASGHKVTEVGGKGLQSGVKPGSTH